MSVLAQQSWQFAALVGIGFMLAAVVFRFKLKDHRDGWHLLMMLTGGAVVLLSNRAITVAMTTRSFLVLIGAGTLLFALGGLTMHLFDTLEEVDDAD